MSKPLVSIIVPYFNTNIELFTRCINSIINQDYINKEIIIIDDGSEKKYADEVETIVSEIECAHVIHQKNRGEGAARNTGIEVSQGRFLIFVDSDDGLAEGWISYAVDLAIKYNSDVVLGRVVRVLEIPEKEIKNMKEDIAYIANSSVWQIQRDTFYFKTSLVDNLDILDPGVCSKLFRKECVEGCSFPEGIKLSADQVYNHTIIRKSEGIVLSNKIAYYYVMNDMSISHIYQPQAVDYMMKSMSLIKPMVFDNEECKQAFNYRVLAEITEAIQYAYFSDKHKSSFFEKIKGVNYAVNHIQVRQALNEINIKMLPDRNWKLKAFLLKKKKSCIFVCLKMISDLFEN